MTFSIYEIQENIVEVEGQTFHLDLSFDDVLRFFDLMDKETQISPMIKIHIGFELLTNEPEPENIPLSIKVSVIKDIIEKYIQTETEEVETDVGSLFLTPEEQEAVREKFKYQLTAEKDQQNMKFFDLKQDAEIIYASFMQEYRIDLLEMQGKLSWQKFKALLHNMRDGTKFKEVVGIRAAKLPMGKHSQKERERLIELKRVYALKQSSDQKVKGMQSMFNKLKGMSKK